MSKFLCNIENRRSIITAIDTVSRFPENLDECDEKYGEAVALFCDMVERASSTTELLDAVRSPGIHGQTRISLLKMYRRCVAPVLDTETTRKITKNSTKDLVDAFGATFKPIDKLKSQFKQLSAQHRTTLAALLGEHDKRGTSGYELTEMFFDWFEEALGGQFSIEGPRRAGRDIELRSLFPEFEHDCPCDFVVRSADIGSVLAVGFARYDSTRGGAQSDDRTGGNADKLTKIEAFCTATAKDLRLFYLADGPGLAHDDTWAAACKIDGMWDGRVRVTTFKLAPHRITAAWLQGKQDNADSDASEAIDLISKLAE